MPRYRYRTLDVFTHVPLEGNPLAVFPDARGLDDVTMGRIARELNLSETVFVLPAHDPGCAARARIFTPAGELPFAGHPTIGTAFVLAADGAVPADATHFALEETIGPVPIRLERDGRFMAWLTTPPIAFGSTVDRAAAARALGLQDDDLVPDVPAQVVTAGVAALFVALRDPARVDRTVFDDRAMRALVNDGTVAETFVFAPVSGGAYARMFAPALGIAEDPATGGLTGPLAAFAMRYGLASRRDGTRFVSEQGVRMGRPSRLHVLVHGEAGAGGIEVGGSVAPLATGYLRL